MEQFNGKDSNTENVRGKDNQLSTNSYANDLYKQIQSQRENAGIDHIQGTTNGAEKSGTKDKDTARKIVRNEYGADQSVSMYADLARYYRMGLNPPRELLEQIYERG